MNKILFLVTMCLFFLSSTDHNAYSIDSKIFQLSADTTIKAGINPDKKMEIISVTFPGLKGGSIYDFILIVDNDTVKGVLNFWMML